MLDFEIEVRSPADSLLYEGLPLLAPALDELGDGALLVGGLAVAAWLDAHPVGLPFRPTRDVDLGIDRQALRITRDRQVVGPLLRASEFRPGYSGEEFRFARETSAGLFVVDCLVAKGASRAQPPIVEAGMSSLAAPGLAYALTRGPVPLRITLVGEERRSIGLRTVTLDSLFVMKATLTAGGHRTRRDWQITDTTDAVMLAAACLEHGRAIEALAVNRRQGEVKVALGWVRDGFASSRAAMPRRVADHFGDEAAATWAVDITTRFVDAIELALRADPRQSGPGSPDGGEQ